MIDEPPPFHDDETTNQGENQTVDEPVSTPGDELPTATDPSADIDTNEQSEDEAVHT